MKDIIAYETFKDIPNIRFFDKIKIYVDFPYSEVTFDKLDFELASRIVGLQFLGGYNDNDDLNRIVYLNGIKINNNDLFVWEENDKLNNYIKKNKDSLKIKDNKYTIRVNKIDQITYIRQTIIERVD